MDLQEYRTQKARKDAEEEARWQLEKEFCPFCNTKFNSFSGNEGIPAGLYCPNCLNAIYDEEGNILCQLE